MKRFLTIFRTLTAACVLIMLTVSCSNDSNAVVNPTAADGSWKISLYWDNTDHTADFAGYVFTFNNNGQVTATNGTATKAGTWSQTAVKFNLDFGTDPLFDKLSDNWTIVEKTAATIKLKDDNPAQDDKLQFTKL
jgi:hypothetical protein